MRKSLALFLLIGIGFYSCNKEPDPEPTPDEIRSYVTLYNFLLEAFEVTWEVDDVKVQGGHPYGTIIPGGILLEQESEDISYVVKNGATGAIVESVILNMTRDKNYLVVLFGSVEQPVLLCQEQETSKPQSGFIKLQFLHATEGLDSVDLYVGGTDPDKKLLSGLAYKDISVYSEVAEYNVRASVIVTLHDTIYKEDNELLSYTYNELLANNNYLSVIAPATNSPVSDLTLWLYTQPVNR